MYGLNDYIVIHLLEPIILSELVRPVCLPPLSQSPQQTQEYLDTLYSENATVLITGWPRYINFEMKALMVQLESGDACEIEWRTRTRTTPSELPYQDRACGYISGTTNSKFLVNH